VIEYEIETKFYKVLLCVYFSFIQSSSRIRHTLLSSPLNLSVVARPQNFLWKSRLPFMPCQWNMPQNTEKTCSYHWN